MKLKEAGHRHRQGLGLPGTSRHHDGNPFVTGKAGPVIATVLNGRKGNLGAELEKDKLDDQKGHRGGA